MIARIAATTPIRAGRTAVLALALLLLWVFPTAAFADGAGLYQSDDDGQTWVYLGSPRGEQFFGLVVDASRPGRLYLAGGDALWLSEDDGGTWRPLIDADGAGDERTFFALVADPLDPNRLWAGTDRGVLRSVDGGQSWQDAARGFEAVSALAVAAETGAVRLLAGHADGLSASTDGGTTWQDDGGGLEGGVLAVSADAGGVALVGTTTGLFSRETGEDAFAPVGGLPRGASRAAIITGSGAAYAAVGSTLYRRSGGWAKLATLPLSAIGDMPYVTAILPREDGRLLLGTDRGLHTSDGWRLVPPFDTTGDLEIATIAASPHRAGRLYLIASSVPHTSALSRIGIAWGPPPTISGGEGSGVVLWLLFLIGAPLAVYYARRHGRARTPPDG